MIRLFPLAILLVSTTVGAQTIIPNLDQEGRPGDVARYAKERAVARFTELDTDKDDRLSREEISKAGAYLADNFDTLDKNKDNFLSWEEFVGHNRWRK